MLVYPQPPARIIGALISMFGIDTVIVCKQDNEVAIALQQTPHLD